MGMEREGNACDGRREGKVLAHLIARRHDSRAVNCRTRRAPVGSEQRGGAHDAEEKRGQVVFRGMRVGKVARGRGAMQQRRGERENGTQTSGGRRPAGVDTARRPTAHAHGACREAMDWPLRHFKLAGTTPVRLCTVHGPDTSCLTYLKCIHSRIVRGLLRAMLWMRAWGSLRAVAAAGTAKDSVGKTQRTMQAAAAGKDNKQKRRAASSEREAARQQTRHGRHRNDGHVRTTRRHQLERREGAYSQT